MRVFSSSYWLTTALATSSLLLKLALLKSVDAASVSAAIGAERRAAILMTWQD